VTARCSATSEPAQRARGYALLAAVLAVALVSLATLVPVQSAVRQAQRERETELLFIGQQYRDAIARYRNAPAGGIAQYPASLNDLLDDRRFPQPRRHLRRLYADPMTGEADWTLLRSQGRIIGVASSDTRAPLKRSGFPAPLAQFDSATSYSDWRFVVDDPAPAGAVGAPQNPAEPEAPPRSLEELERLSERRSQCLRSMAAEMQACLNATAAQACRDSARQRFLACVRG
jgi:type II secretory pathway pseudopilin PulG